MMAPSLQVHAGLGFFWNELCILPEVKDLCSSRLPKFL